MKITYLSVYFNISKVLKNIIFKQIVDFMDKERLLYLMQHAYKKDKSTVSALIALHEKWIKATDKLI